MEREPGDPGVFIRSMASRGHTGGIATTTRDVARLLDAFGFDVILIETVGSGQVDVEIREVATTSVVVLVPHLGDEVQTLKAGLFEIADVFCVNKGDLPGADLAKRDLSELVGLGQGRDGWRPPIVVTSTQANEGSRTCGRPSKRTSGSWKRAVSGRRASVDASRTRSWGSSGTR